MWSKLIFPAYSLVLSICKNVLWIYSRFQCNFLLRIPVGGANVWLTAYSQTISMGTAKRPRLVTKVDWLATKVVVFNLDTDSLNTNLTQECARGQLWKVGLVWRHFTNIISEKKKKCLSWTTKGIDSLMTLLLLNKSLIKYFLIVSNNLKTLYIKD